MSKDTVHSLAQADTPAIVDVPNTWSGLVIWAVGRFGSGILIAALCVAGIVKVYGDLKEQNQALITLIKEQTAASSGLQSTLSELKTSLLLVVSEVKRAHGERP